MKEISVGRVVRFFPRPGAAAVRIDTGRLAAGDAIRIKGNVTDLYHRIDSLEIGGLPADAAGEGETVGIGLIARAREGDEVYKVLEER